ncbi:MAG: ABC transporter permease [Maledivibacter sp.]|jgi:peptide/nickel transport system permease protein|nr:ABC transporter permease [Maledivibacter sp.]
MLKGHKLSYFICIIILAFSALGFLFTPNDPHLVNLSIRLQKNSLQYPLGTDAMGRCVFSRILYGGQTTLGIVFLSSIIIILFGVPIGLLMGSTKRTTGVIGESILNAVTALPPMAYLIVFLGAWGSGVFTTMIAVGLSLFLRVIKLVKAKTEIEYSKAYVMCAVASGASKCRILLVHIFPNVLPEVMGFLSLSCGHMIMMITGFSFMGLGFGDSVIDWGSMILEAQKVSMIRPEMIVYPIIVVFLCTVSFNVLGNEQVK